MKIWREGSLNPVGHQGGITSCLEEWLREKLERMAPATIKLETNLGALDEAGIFRLDLDWAGLVAAEFPQHRIDVRYLPPAGPEEGKTPYFVALEMEGDGVLKAEVHTQRPGSWLIYEDFSGAPPASPMTPHGNG